MFSIHQRRLLAHLIVVLLLAFVTNYQTTDAIALNCSYGMNYFALRGNLYTCTATVVIFQNENVTAVYGAHESEKGHLDVQGIILSSQNLILFPTNMEAFFPNLLAIQLSNNSITSISNRHLIPFPNLQFLSISVNKISMLDSNLFSGISWTSSNHYINFDLNDITHVGHDINLPFNGRIQFSDNTCISEVAETSDKISILKLNLLRYCPPTISQIEETLASRPNLLTELKISNTQLENRCTELENRSAELEGSNTRLINSNIQLQSRSTELENRSTQLERRVAYLEAIIENKLGLKTE